MTAGATVTKFTVDARAASIARAVEGALDDARALLNWLQNGTTPADLLALGYEQADVDLLMASFTDLVALAAVATGGAAQPAPSNFFFHSSQLTGVPGTP